MFGALKPEHIIGSMSYKMLFSKTSLFAEIKLQHRQKAAVCTISHVDLYTQLAINNNKVPLATSSPILAV